MVFDLPGAAPGDGGVLRARARAWPRWSSGGEREREQVGEHVREGREGGQRRGVLLIHQGTRQRGDRAVRGRRAGARPLGRYSGYRKKRRRICREPPA